MMYRSSRMAAHSRAARVLCAAALMAALAGCGVGSAPLHAPTAASTAATTTTQVYYQYQTGIPLPSGASAPNGGKVVAFDVGNGSVAWRYTLPTTRRPSVFQPLEVNGVVYVASYTDDPQRNTLDALDAQSGKLLWSHTAPGMLADQVVVADNAVYVSARQQDNADGFNGSLQRLDARSGALAWQVSLAGSPSPATVSGDTIYLASMGTALGKSQLVALDAATGATRWRYTSQGQLSTQDPRNTEGLFAPIVVGSVVSVISTVRDSQGSAIQSVLALDTTTGGPRWSYSTGGIVGAPLVVGGALYISASVQAGNTSDSSLLALRMRDGALQWRRPAPAGHGFVTGLAFVDGQGAAGARLLAVETNDPVPSPSAELVALAPGDGRTLWTTPLGQNAADSPLLVDDLALVQVVARKTPGPGDVQLVAVQPADGHIRWRQVVGDWPELNGAILGIRGGSVLRLVTVYSGAMPTVYLLALRGSDGARQWRVIPR